MKYLNIFFALLPSLSIAKLGDSRHDRRQQANPTLVQVGLNSSVKLGRCEGDCANDSDCNSSDLVCFPRTTENEAVPGCSGGLNDTSLYDYCVRKSDLNDAPTPSAPTPSAPTPSAPTPSAPTQSAPTQSAPTQSAPTQSAGGVRLKYTTVFPLALCEGTSNGVKKCKIKRINMLTLHLRRL
jgi:hypothetical protein